MIDPRLERFLTEGLGTRAIRHSGRDLYTHLKGTHDLLEAWGNGPDVCRAGLFHSVYGTASFRHNILPLGRRDIVCDLLGPEAERLVYVFCVTFRPQAFLSLVGTNQRIVYDRHARRLIALTQEELDSLLEIEAANLIEQGGRSAGKLQILLRGGLSPAAKHHVGALLMSTMPGARLERDGWQTEIRLGSDRP